MSVLAKLSQNDEAKKQLGILFGLAENDARLLFEVARWQRTIKDFEGAKKTHNKLALLVPDNLMVKVEKVNLLIANQQLTTAENQAKELLKQTNNNPNVLGVLGDIYVAKQDKTQAFDYFWQAIETDPNFDLMLFKLYQLAAEGVNPDKVTVLLTRSKEAKPQQLWRTRLLADHYFNILNWQKAEPLYRELLTHSEFEFHPYVLNNLAIIELESDPSVALINAQKAFELEPTNANIIDTLAWAHAKLGAHRKALELLRTAYTLDSGNLEIQYHLAYVLNKLDRNAEAEQHLTAILNASNDANSNGFETLQQNAQSILDEITQKSL